MKCESALCHQVDYANSPMFGKTQTAQVGNTDAVSLVRFLISVISTDCTKPNLRIRAGPIDRAQYGVPRRRAKR
jgi:hypothetical protein